VAGGFLTGFLYMGNRATEEQAGNQREPTLDGGNPLGFRQCPPHPGAQPRPPWLLSNVQPFAVTGDAGKAWFITRDQQITYQTWAKPGPVQSLGLRTERIMRLYTRPGLHKPKHDGLIGTESALNVTVPCTVRIGSEGPGSLSCLL
jgi:hypothetical protein